MSHPPVSESPETPGPALRARILAEAGASPAPTRHQARPRDVALIAAATAAACAIFVFFGGPRIGPRPPSLVVLTSLGAAVVAGVSVFIAFGPSRSMLGRPRKWLLAMVMLAPLAYFAWKMGVTTPFDAMSDPWPTRPGWRCFRLSLFMSLLPLAAVIYVRRRSDPTHPRAFGAALGVAVGVSAAVLVDLWCPVAYVYHLLLGHLLPMAILAAVGAWAGGMFLAIRRR